MKSMRDPPFGDVLCTVLDRAGSTYGKPGLRVRIHADGSMDGMLNGGCFDADLIEQSVAVRADGIPRVLLYDARDPADEIYGSGSGCRGAITVLMEAAPAPGSPFARWLDSLVLERPGPGLAVTSIAGRIAHGEPVELERLQLVSPSGTELLSPADSAMHRTLPGGSGSNASTVATLHRLAEGQSVFVERAPVPLRLLVVGGGRDAEPVVALAATLGWRTVVLDHRPARVNARLFPAAEAVELARLPHRSSASTSAASSARAAVKAGADVGGVLIDNTSTAFDAALVMTHNLTLDADALAWLAVGDIPFIGLLGPAGRRDRLLAEIGAGAGRLTGRLFAPVGLHLGGSTPEAIALAIVAQVQAHGAGATGGPLSTQTLVTSSLIQSAGISTSA